MILDRFQESQTRAGWILCWSAGAVLTLLSYLRAPSVWPIVLLGSVANVIFYQLYVNRPTRRGVRTTRDFLLLVINRAVSIPVACLTFLVTAVGMAATRMVITPSHIAGLVALGLICATSGSRFAVKQWRTRSDLEITARDSAKLAMDFRNRYSVLLFASIGVAWGFAVRYVGVDVAPALIAVVCAGGGSHLLGYLVTKQIIILRLLPKGADAGGAG